MPKGDLVTVFAFRGLNIAASLVSLLHSPFEASLGLYHSLYLWILAIDLAFSNQNSGFTPCGRCRVVVKEEFYSVGVLCLYIVTSPRVCKENAMWQTLIR